MAYKKLSEATFIESVSDEATVLVEENDEIKRVPKRVMGKVKTVNGAEPDENGNVEVEIPEATWESLPDKPFESLGVVKTPVLEEQTLNFVKQEEAPIDIGFAMTDFILEEGKTYEIVFDGETYQCDSFVVDQVFTSIVIGNTGLVGGGSDTGEPFIFMYAPEPNIRQAGASEGNHVVSITMVEEEIKTINPKFLPEALQFGSEVVKTEETFYEESFSVTINSEYFTFPGTYDFLNNAYEIPNYEQSYAVITYESETVPKLEVVFDIPDTAYENDSWAEPAWESSVNGSRLYTTEASFELFFETDYMHDIPIGDTGTLTVAVKSAVEKEEVKPIDPKYLPNIMLYVNNNDRYFYSDAAMTVKVSKPELQVISLNNFVRVVDQDGNVFMGCQCACNYVEDYGAIHVFTNTAGNVAITTYFTSEMVPSAT